MPSSNLKNIILLIVILVSSIILLDWFGLLGAVSAGGQFITSQFFIGFLFIGAGLYMLIRKFGSGFGFGVNEIIISAMLVVGVMMYFKLWPFLMALNLMSVYSVGPVSITIPPTLNLDVNYIVNVMAAIGFSYIIYYAIKRR